MPFNLPAAPAEGDVYSFLDRAWVSKSGLWRRWPSAAAGTTNFALNPGAYGYPDATNTGPTISLTDMPVSSSGSGWTSAADGYVIIDVADTVLEGYHITGGINVRKSGVIVRNCWIESLARNDEFMCGIGYSGDTINNVIFEDCLFTAADATTNRTKQAIKNIYGTEFGTIIRRCEFYHYDTPVQMDNGTMRDCYLHDFGFLAGDHCNGITSNGTNGQLDIIHNTIFNDINQTDCVGLFQDFGPQTDRLIEDNLLAGGGYSIYGGQNPGAPFGDTANIKVRNNRFSKKFYATSGSFGTHTAYLPSGTGNEWSGNIWDEDLTAIPAA